jgi:hypothetical protein
MIGTDEYIELLLLHLVNCPEVMAKAKRFNLVGDDVVINEVYGTQLYEAFLDAVMAVGEAPVAPALFMSHLAVSERPIEQEDENFQRLLEFVYDTGSPLNPGYFVTTMKEFIKAMRWRKVKFQWDDDPEQLLEHWRPIATALAIDNCEAQAVHVRPFENMIIKPHENTIGTGIAALDNEGCGLNLGEYGLIIGYTGGGKTAFGVNITLNNALAGRRSQFISLEEDETEIAQRYYSNLFEINYTELHKGHANIQLVEMFRQPPSPAAIEMLNRNLCLTGMKGVQGVTPGIIYDVMLRNFENTGFAPSIVVLDQMQFLTPDGYKKTMDGWEKEKLVAAELDELSHKTIGGHKFCLWVLHQAKGNRKRRFKEEDVEGYKGISHTTDLVLGIGRDSESSDECSVFTLKNRHGAEFDVDVQTELQYMRFLGVDLAPATEAVVPALALN